MKKNLKTIVKKKRKRIMKITILIHRLMIFQAVHENKRRKNTETTKTKTCPKCQQNSENRSTSYRVEPPQNSNKNC